MDFNKNAPTINTEPGAYEEAGGGILHTDIDIDQPDIKQECVVQYSEINGSTTVGVLKAMEAVKRDVGPHKNTRQNLTTQTSRLNSLPSTNKISKKTRSNQKQMNMLVDFMATHPEFAAGRCFGPQGQQINRGLWKELAEQLAEIGPLKSVEQLKTTWRDLKCKTRAEAKRAALRTGNSTRTPVLTYNRRKIINILDGTISEGNDLPQSITGEGPIEVDLEFEFDQLPASFSPASRPLCDPVGPSVSCSGTDSGTTSQAEKRKRTASPEQVSNRMMKINETGDDPVNQFVKAINRIGDIFERFTAAYVESVEMRRHQQKSKRLTTHKGGRAAYSSTDLDVG